MKNLNGHLSNCHKAPVEIVGGDEGTNHWECTKCKNSCQDLFYQEPIQLDNPKPIEPREENCQKIGWNGETFMCKDCGKDYGKDFLEPREDDWEDDVNEKLANFAEHVLYQDARGHEPDAGVIRDFITFIRTHKALWERQAREEERARLRELSEYTTHETDCILSEYRAGRPTKNGGYEQKFGDKWYEVRPIDKTPECSCGVANILSLLDGEGEGK